MPEHTPRPITALTIDFWNTMVVAKSNGRPRQAQRMTHLLALVRQGRPEATEDDVNAAFREAVRRFDADWRTHHRTPATETAVRCLWEVLAVEMGEADHAATVRLFEEGLLHHPPDFADGLADALAWAAGRYRLGIISDTMFSPGRVIRDLLAQHGLLRYFDAFVFSDETGFAKPDVRAFARAADALGTAPETLAHIGDLRRTDVAGAREAGATAVLFTGVHQDAEPGPAPHLVLDHWRALPALIENWRRET